MRLWIPHTPQTHRHTNTTKSFSCWLFTFNVFMIYCIQFSIKTSALFRLMRTGRNIYIWSQSQNFMNQIVEILCKQYKTPILTSTEYKYILDVYIWMGFFFSYSFWNVLWMHCNAMKWVFIELGAVMNFKASKFYHFMCRVIYTQKCHWSNSNSLNH